MHYIFHPHCDKDRSPIDYWLEEDQFLRCTSRSSYARYLIQWLLVVFAGSSWDLLKSCIGHLLCQDYCLLLANFVMSQCRNSGFLKSLQIFFSHQMADNVSLCTVMGPSGIGLLGGLNDGKVLRMFSGLSLTVHENLVWLDYFCQCQNDILVYHKHLMGKIYLSTGSMSILDFAYHGLLGLVPSSLIPQYRVE